MNLDALGDNTMDFLTGIIRGAGERNATVSITSQPRTLDENFACAPGSNNPRQIEDNCFGKFSCSLGGGGTNSVFVDRDVLLIPDSLFTYRIIINFMKYGLDWPSSSSVMFAILLCYA